MMGFLPLENVPIQIYKHTTYKREKGKQRQKTATLNMGANFERIVLNFMT